jgi:Zn finger protein HypA/HybF involved in hydrogenase expression
LKGTISTKTWRKTVGNAEYLFFSFPFFTKESLGSILNIEVFSPQSAKAGICMKCQQCGDILQEGARFCPKCGAAMC